MKWINAYINTESGVKPRFQCLQKGNLDAVHKSYDTIKNFMKSCIMVGKKTH